MTLRGIPSWQPQAGKTGKAAGIYATEIDGFRQEMALVYFVLVDYSALHHEFYFLQFSDVLKWITADATRSAHFPASIVPVLSLQPRSSAATEVPVRMDCIGVMPYCT